MTFFVYCNEFPGSARYSISYSANVFDDQIYCNLSGGGSLGEFDDPENMVECIPAAFYDNISFTVSLSPADRAIGKESLVSGTKIDLASIMENGKFGLQTYTLAMCFNDQTRTPVDSYSFYTWVPTTVVAANVQTSMIFTGFAAYQPEGCDKYCGPRTRVARVEYILPWEQNWNEEKETYTPFSSISQFNIRPAQQDIKNFLYPLYASSTVSFKVSEDNTKIEGASCDANYYGMFHEKMNYGGGVSVLKSFSIDGVEKEFNDILEVGLDGNHSFDFTFYNPDGFVQGEFPTEALNVLHVATANTADMIPPKMIGLQMYDADGKIKTVFDPEEECTLLVAMYDRTTANTTSLDFDVKLYAAKQDTEDWVEITNPEVTEHDARLGKTYEFAIPTDGTLEINKWNKFKIVGEDASGNSNTMILDYCLGIGVPDSINGINTDGFEGAPVYYNLQGHRIDSPVKGEVVIEKAGGKTRKVTL